jgi:Metal binding domain of Ada
VFPGLLTVILIGLMVENQIFRVVEIRTVQRWGMQHRAGARIAPAYAIRVSGGADRPVLAARTERGRPVGPGVKEQKHVVRDIDASARRGEPAAFSNDDARWEAVQRRDRSADGAFLYAVRTTGVYCRPSCAARPRRENVVFCHQRPEFHPKPAV